MDAGELWKTGVAFRRPETDHAGRLQKHLLPLGRATSLTELLEDFAFFTPAILYLHGSMTDDPLIDFLYSYQQNVDFYYHKFRRTVFLGLHTRHGDTDWNHALWAVRREHWDAFSSFYLSVGIALTDSKQINKVGQQLLHVPDPLASDNAVVITGRIPAVEVSAFGIDGSLGRLAFEESINPLNNVPRLRGYPPTKVMAAYAKSFYSGDNPEYVRDQISWEQLCRSLQSPSPKLPGLPS